MKKIVFIVFLVLSIVLLTDGILWYYYGISLSGYYSDVILFWSWFFVSISIIVLFWKKILAKLFLTAMVLALVLSILPLALPFYTFIFSMSPAGLKLDNNLNEKYRAQIVGYSPMMLPWLEVIEKRGLLEKKLFQCTEINIASLQDNNIEVKYEAQLRPVLRISQAKKVLLKSETDSTLTVVLFYGNPNRLLMFDKLTRRLKDLK